MPSLRKLVLSGLLAVQGAWASTSGGLSLEEYIRTERTIALQGVLDNIGPKGKKVPGAARGLVIASPSTVDPDYFYTWTRDAALTFRTIIDDFLFGNKELESYIEDYIYSQAVLQTVSNPSGALLPHGTGLGEPKYTANGTRYNGNWGRPQRDGPALRAIALIQYSKHLITQGEHDRAKTVIWPVISNDLSYVGQYWNSTGYDLWEEVSGSSFFTTHNQYRALVEGASLAATLGVSCTGCGEAPQVLCFLQSYWNGKSYTGNLVEGGNGRIGVDANTILSPIAVFDPAASCESPTLQPCHPRSLANFKVFVDTFRNSTLYPINDGIPGGQGIALGRYPEDIYYDGNPWYLITVGAAEFLYDVVVSWTKSRVITIDETSLPFFKEIYPHAKKGRLGCGDRAYAEIRDRVRSYADSFVAVAQEYTPANGMLAEQFLKSSPFTPISAANLTWSFAAFVSMTHRRDGHLPNSWIPKSGPHQPVVLEECKPGGAVQGAYAPATAAGAPNITIPCTSMIRFQVNALTYYGENVYVTGSGTTLGDWDLDNAYPLLSSNYTEQHPVWWADIPLEMAEGSGESTVKYKYARQQDCGQDWIVEEAERSVDVPACRTDGSEDIVAGTNDTYIGKGGSAGGC